MVITTWLPSKSASSPRLEHISDEPPAPPSAVVVPEKLIKPSVRSLISVSTEEILSILKTVPAFIWASKPAWRVIAPVPVVNDNAPLSSSLASPLIMRMVFPEMKSFLPMRTESTRVVPSPAPSSVVIPE
ncbi:hypothetical protein ES703_64442 [subsurface metagenome]